jgi:uncharacterized repeat protein (TIGR01451 family)
MSHQKWVSIARLDAMQTLAWRTATALLILTVCAAAAQAADPVTNVLTVRRIARQPDGRETTEVATSAKPGDVLEYVAEFHNNGTTAARGLSATLPLPSGTEFISESQHPSDASASVDGITFEPIPLKRRVKGEDGTPHEELVPLRDYRYLRWPAAELAGGASLSVSARVVISP